MKTSWQQWRTWVLVGLMGACSVVWADKGGNGHGRDKGDDDWERHGRKHDRDDERRAPQGYVDM